ncbi:MAG: PmeII family type II restriction endonuclease [Coriobacteriia bacterium]
MSYDQEELRALVLRELRKFADNRIAFYDDPRRSSLDHLLKKDVLMFAARGVLTADEFIDDCFRAFESSSEEGVMGTRWQAIVAALSEDTLDTGDLTTVRDNALWVCEVKAQYNTTNSSSDVQELRDLKTRVADTKRPRRATPMPVKAAFCVLRGPDVDQARTYTPKRHGENEDLRGFEYRYISGRSLWRWLTGVETPLDLVGDLDDLEVDAVREARTRCVTRIRLDMHTRLEMRGLGTSIADVLKLI